MCLHSPMGDAVLVPRPAPSSLYRFRQGVVHSRIVFQDSRAVKPTSCAQASSHLRSRAGHGKITLAAHPRGPSHRCTMTARSRLLLGLTLVGLVGLAGGQPAKSPQSPLSPAEALKTFKLPDGYRIEL